jgi:hypothetical protein
MNPEPDGDRQKDTGRAVHHPEIIELKDKVIAAITEE